ncbi:hypothetical protein BD779DRAFT_143700 [Infundibulicybe gibba]|nr:hypothetical protein BD779DRAFT_143700 [Infundibulicybe gibba]
MAIKRKFQVESDDVTPTKSKQLKLIPFPNFSVDEDIAMSEAEPLHLEAHHIRLPSDVSSTSSNSSDSPTYESPAYPSFNIYPLPFFGDDGLVDPNSHNFAHYAAQTPPVGLIQPSSSFAHHGSHCSQIPKLRVACASGINGQRTMWSFCEQCGAISMVDSD